MKQILSTGLLLLALYAAAGCLPACEGEGSDTVDGGNFSVDITAQLPPDAPPAIDTTPLLPDADPADAGP